MINLDGGERPKVTLTFNGDEVLKKTEGFKGGRCVEATKFIEELLNPTEQKVQFTSEYHDVDTDTNTSGNILA